MLVVQMFSTCNFWLNVFPPKDGVSRNINPRELITGVQIDYNKHIQAEFGEYVQVHEEHDNTMITCTTGTIATKPTGNAQGGHWFYSLSTGRMLNRRRWTPLPMPGDVIERLNALAKASQVGMHFTNMRNIDYHDDDYYDSDNDSDDDSDYDSDDKASDHEDDDYDNFIAGVDRHNSDPPDPPDENADERGNNNIHNDTEETSDDEDAGYSSPNDDAEDTSENEYEHETDYQSENETDDHGIPDEANDDTPIVPVALKKLTDWNGDTPPTIQSRTRQDAQDNGESLLTGANTEKWTTVTKKQRRLKKELESQLRKREDDASKKNLRNRLKNEKRPLRTQNKKKEGEHPRTKTGSYGNMRDQLQAAQKPGVCFPDDSCLSKDLTPDLEAIALTQYTLK
jgi:hypothetical protein